MGNNTPAPDGETLSDEQVVEIINAARQYASDWYDWATHAQCDRFLHALDELHRSHRNVSVRVAKLHAELESREAKWEAEYDRARREIIALRAELADARAESEWLRAEVAAIRKAAGDGIDEALRLVTRVARAASGEDASHE